METGTGGIFPTSPAAFQARQWRHQVRTARARTAAPGSVPLVSRRGAIVAGAVIRASGHRAADLAMIPYQRLRSHQVVIGTTGTGKTTLLLRLWAGFLTRGLQLHAAGAGRRPLLVVLDCKGGADSRRVADRVRRVLRGAGARFTAVWPDEASLSLWELPPAELTTTLLDMIEHGTGAAAYYADVMEAIVALAVGAPAGPPASAADFLARLDAGWLALAYAGPGHGDEAALLRSASRHVTDIALRFRTLFRRLGPGLDGPGSYGDADAWYCILEGTAEVAVAESQARALVDLLAHYAAHGPGAGREILLAVDEFSAVSRRLPIWQLYERARSLGLAVQVSAQSWQGLAPDDDDRYRLAATADGGIWLLRTPYPEPVTALAGEQPALDTSRRLLGVPRWGREGSSRVRESPVADPALIRRLDVGQAAYIYRGGVTFVQVKRLVAAPGRSGGRAGQPAQRHGRRSPGRPERAAGPDGRAAAPAATQCGHRRASPPRPRRTRRRSRHCSTRRSARNQAEPVSRSGVWHGITSLDVHLVATTTPPTTPPRSRPFRACVHHECHAAPDSSRHQAFALQEGEWQCPCWSVDHQVLACAGPRSNITTMRAVPAAGCGRARGGRRAGRPGRARSSDGSS